MGCVVPGTLPVHADKPYHSESVPQQDLRLGGNGLPHTQSSKIHVVTSYRDVTKTLRHQIDVTT